MSAVGESIIVGHGEISITLNEGTTISAYHTPEFSANILSVGELSNKFNILFTCDRPSKKGVSKYFIKTRPTNRVAFSVQIEAGLYTMDHPKQKLNKNSLKTCKYFVAHHV